jgi:DNA adenine methylase/adenine-specific DNA-methyltransferase
MGVMTIFPRSVRTQKSNVVPIKPFAENVSGVLERANAYPELRYMGSKKRLLPWIHQVLSTLDFESALDPFSGTGCVAYLMKAMGTRVVASDFLNFSSLIVRATVENYQEHLDGKAVRHLLDRSRSAHRFIETTFAGVFYTQEDLRFLDSVSGNIRQLEDPFEQALAFAALFRSCLKRPPRRLAWVEAS